MGNYELNKNLAQMLKGGVIMDVTNVEQAKIAEASGACAVMALERCRQIFVKMVACQNVRSSDDQGYKECRIYSCNGKSENRSLCGSSDFGGHWH